MSDNSLVTTPKSNTISLTLDHGRKVTLSMPLKIGTYEHLSEHEQFEVATFIRLKSVRSENTHRAYVSLRSFYCG